MPAQKRLGEKSRPGDVALLVLEHVKVGVPASGTPGLCSTTSKERRQEMSRAGMAERVIMEVGGWRTRSIFDRYRIVDERDIFQGLAKLAGRSGTIGAQSGEGRGTSARAEAANSLVHGAGGGGRTRTRFEPNGILSRATGARLSGTIGHNRPPLATIAETRWWPLLPLETDGVPMVRAQNEEHNGWCGVGWLQGARGSRFAGEQRDYTRRISEIGLHHRGRGLAR